MVRLSSGGGGDNRLAERERRFSREAAPAVANRWEKIQKLIYSFLEENKSCVFFSSRPAATTTASSSSAPAPSGSATTGKKKTYVMVRTLRDGTKIREKISADDPILAKVSN